MCTVTETIPGVEVLGVKPPAITYNYDVNVKKLDNGNVVVTVSGSHDQFPAHVIAATRTEQPGGKATVVYSFDPIRQELIRHICFRRHPLK